VAKPLNPKLVQFWRDRIARQMGSGLTIVHFCAQEGCARATLHNWKRRFQSPDAPRPPKSFSGNSSPETTSTEGVSRIVS
jgi:hypothetical protein